MNLILAAKRIEFHLHQCFQMNCLKITRSRCRFYVRIWLSTSLDIADEQHMHGITCRRVGMLDKHVQT